VVKLLNKRHQSWTLHLKQTVDGISGQADKEIVQLQKQFTTDKLNAQLQNK
jgi:hypothetical protein